MLMLFHLPGTPLPCREAGLCVDEHRPAWVQIPPLPPAVPPMLHLRNGAAGLSSLAQCDEGSVSQCAHGVWNNSWHLVGAIWRVHVCSSGLTCLLLLGTLPGGLGGLCPVHLLIIVIATSCSDHSPDAFLLKSRSPGKRQILVCLGIFWTHA